MLQSLEIDIAALLDPHNPRPRPRPQCAERNQSQTFVMSNPIPNPMPVGARPMDPSMRYGMQLTMMPDVASQNYTSLTADYTNVCIHSPYPVNTMESCITHYCTVK